MENCLHYFMKSEIFHYDIFKTEGINFCFDMIFLF